MSNIRKETAELLVSKLNTMNSMSKEMGVSEPTLRKIKKLDDSVSLKTVKMVNLFLEKYF